MSRGTRDGQLAALLGNEAGEKGADEERQRAVREGSLGSVVGGCTLWASVCGRALGMVLCRRPFFPQRGRRS